jgi:hypothetical protein
MSALQQALIAASAGGGSGDDVILLLHLDGTDGSTTITDASTYAHSVTAQGGAQLKTAQKQFGSASVFLEGTAAYLYATYHSKFNFGANDFTVECWVRPTDSSTADYRAIMCHDQIGVTRGWLLFADVTTGYLTGVIWDGATSATVSGSSNLLSTYLNTWVHVAMTREGSTLRLFVGGTLVASNASAGLTIGSNIMPLVVGTLYGNGVPVAGTKWKGYVDEVRVISGTAKYTAGFTPAGPFTL